MYISFVFSIGVFFFVGFFFIEIPALRWRIKIEHGYNLVDK